MPIAFRHRFDTPRDKSEVLHASRPAAPIVAPPELMQLLKSRGLKATLTRVRVLMAVRDHTLGGQCLTSDEVYRAVSRQGADMALPQICTNLALLVESDLLERYKLGEGRTLFSLKQGQRWSAFSVCTVCHKTQGIRNAALDALLAEMTRQQQLHQPESTVVLRGQCPGCAKTARRLS